MQTVSDVLQSTHYDGCWKLHSHHDCALARIVELEEDDASTRDSYDRYIEMANARIAELEAQLAAMPKWTRITDVRPPEDSDRVVFEMRRNVTWWYVLPPVPTEADNA